MGDKRKMSKEELPSVNPKLDAMCEMLKTIHDLNERNKMLEAQIEKMKQELDTAREEANRQEQWELYSVLNGIYNDNFEVITSVSN